MKIHDKKITPEWFELRLKGLKDWEIRVNDCDYQAGDYMILREYDNGKYTQRGMIIRITNVAKNVPYLPNNVVILSTKDATTEEQDMIIKELNKLEEVKK